MTAEQLINRHGLPSLNIKTVARYREVGITTLKRWAIKDPELFVAEVVAESNLRLAQDLAATISDRVLGLLGEEYTVSTHQHLGVVMVEAWRNDADNIRGHISLSYDAPDDWVREAANILKEALSHV